MKKITVGILILLFFCTIAYTYKDFDEYKVLKVADAAHIYIDLNKNLQIDDNELVNVYGIAPFKDSSSQLTSNINNKYRFYLDYFAKEWAEKELLNKLVKIKKIKADTYVIYLNNTNYAEKLLKEGFALSDQVEYDKYNNLSKIKDKIKYANREAYVILNVKNNKYHKLGCKYGQKSYEYKLVPFKQLPKNAIKCGYCYRKTYKKYHNFFDKQVPINDYKNFKNINVYFIDFSNNKRPVNSCTTSACKDLLSEINNAKYTIDFAIYGINKQSDIFNALVNAKKRGVNIRWVSDFDSKTDNYYPDTLKLMKVLNCFNTDNLTKNFLVPKRDRNALMHNKFFIFDNKKVWTGSANITDTDFSNFNANYAILVSSKNIAKIYTKEFEQLFNGSFHNIKSKETSNNTCEENNTKITVLFSPQDRIINSKILKLIDESKTYIYIPIFYLTHKELAKHLITAQKRGVDIKIITDATSAHGKYSIHKSLRNAGIKVKTENKAGKMHMKTIIIDDKYSIIGSMNFTKNGESHNDENVLILQNKEITKYLKSTFLYMWNEIPQKYLNRDPRAEAPESIGSCFDGIDNDFDGLIDKKDDSCSFKKYVKKQ